MRLKIKKSLLKLVKFKEIFTDHRTKRHVQHRVHYMFHYIAP